MNAQPTVAGEHPEASLPAALQQHPALVRLRACLQAQQPDRDTVDAVCNSLLRPEQPAADSPDHTGSPRT